MRASILIFFLISISLLKGQIANYVNNPSFELIAGNVSAFNDAKYWSPIDSTQCDSHYLVGMPPYGNAPNFSTGFQYPRTGKNFILTAFFCNNCPRWYARNKLKQSLKPNTTYCAKYYVVNTNNNRVAIENYGMYFGDASIDTIKKCSIPLNYLNPQIEYSGAIITDTLRWVPISGTFTAVGTEKYMILGNFKSNATTNTMVLNTPTWSTMSNDIYIDDVSLIEMDLPAFAGRDTTVLPGDSIYIGRQSDIGIDEACIWYKLPDITNPIDTLAGCWINPTSTATYVVKQQLWCNYTPKWDTVIVTVDPTVGNVELPMRNVDLRVFPNPANDYLEISVGKNFNVKSLFAKARIYNRVGQLALEEEPANKITIMSLPEGVYLLQLSGNSGTINKRFVIAR